MDLNIKVSTVLYTSYKVKDDKGDDKYNMKIRILYKGTQKNFKTKYYFTQDEFNEILGRTSTRIYSKKEREKKKFEVKALQQKYIDLIESMPVFTFALLQQEIDKEKKKYSLELFKILEEEEQNYRQNNQLTSAAKCKEAISSIKRVLKVKEVLMVDVTPNFLYKYEQEALKFGHSTTTISIYMRYIKLAFNHCTNNGLLNSKLYPFGSKKPKYVMIKGKQRKSALDVADMNLFKKATTANVPYIGIGRSRFYLDLFLFSYYTFGMNIIDILLLQKDHVYNGFIDTTRKKVAYNQTPLNIPLRGEAQKIIDTYNNPNSKFVFDVLKGGESAQQLKDRSQYYVKKINNVLKKITEKYHISKKVTTYTARHTAANQLLREEVPIATISQLLGHADIKTTQQYLKKLPDYNIQKQVMDIAM